MTNDIMYEVLDITLAQNTAGTTTYQYVSTGSYERITGIALYKSAMNGVTHVNIGIEDTSDGIIQKPTHIEDWLSTSNYAQIERYKPMGLQAKGAKYNVNIIVPAGQSVGAGGVVLQMVFRLERKSSC